MEGVLERSDFGAHQVQRRVQARLQRVQLGLDRLNCVPVLLERPLRPSLAATASTSCRLPRLVTLVCHSGQQPRRDALERGVHLL
eukprot:5547568-Prymnesium_polylepis.1